MKPFITSQIDRFGDTARVQIIRIEFTDTSHTRTVLEDYETASRGATASARRTIAKLKA